MFELAQRHRPLIWLADDSPIERSYTARALGSTYDFEEFSDGADVIERLQRGGRQPDVLLLDWVMPGMSGDEVCRFVRSNATTADVQVILVTASRIETGDVVAGLASGANDYVARPFAIEELRARVETAIRTRHLNTAASRERLRLRTLNELGVALFEAGPDIERILDRLAKAISSMADGCAVMILPGELPSVTIAQHHADHTGRELAAISALADPCVRDFTSAGDARAALPPAYHGYIDRFGLRSLAILPLPARAQVQGVVTVTRDGTSPPLDADDVAAIETCIEYASLAVQNALRFEAERLARAQLDAVLQHLPIGIVAADPEGAVTLVNAAARRTLPGIAEARDLAAVRALGEWSAADGGELAAERTPFAGHDGTTTAVITPSAGGGALTLSITAVALPAGRDGAAGTVSAIEDVSATRAAAAERERVARYQQELLGIVGHDLRTPIGAIVTGLELLEVRAGEQPQIAQVVTRLQSSATRMTRIVEQLLDMTRSRLGKGIPLELREADLAAVVRSSAEEVALAFPRAQFAVHVPASIQGIWDPDRLSRVISNLASNAAQYGKPGATVDIRGEVVGDEVQLTVHNELRDKPIPPDQLEALFDPYRRGSERSRYAAGLGLGLYIVQEILQAHRGTISVTSDATGTTFLVRLPRDSRTPPPA